MTAAAAASCVHQRSSCAAAVPGPCVPLCRVPVCRCRAGPVEATTTAAVTDRATATAMYSHGLQGAQRSSTTCSSSAARIVYMQCNSPARIDTCAHTPQPPASHYGVRRVAGRCRERGRPFHRPRPLFLEPLSSKYVRNERLSKWLPGCFLCSTS